MQSEYVAFQLWREAQSFQNKYLSPVLPTISSGDVGFDFRRRRFYHGLYYPRRFAFASSCINQIIVGLGLPGLAPSGLARLKQNSSVNLRRKRYPGSQSSGHTWPGSPEQSLTALSPQGSCVNLASSRAKCCFKSSGKSRPTMRQRHRMIRR